MSALSIPPLVPVGIKDNKQTSISAHKTSGMEKEEPNKQTDSLKDNTPKDIITVTPEHKVAEQIRKANPSEEAGIFAHYDSVSGKVVTILKPEGREVFQPSAETLEDKKDKI